VVGPGQEDRLAPLHVSWGYRPNEYPLGEENPLPLNRDMPDAFGSTPRTRFLEFEGTRDICPWLAIPTAIDFQTAIGWSAIRQRMHELSELARQLIGPITLREATPRHPAMHGSLTAFEVPICGHKQANALRKAIWEHRIEMPVIERPDRTLIRVSGHFYNTHDEIQRLQAILGEAIQVARES
jgi:isopenicillin-N epimerase